MAKGPKPQDLNKSLEISDPSTEPIPEHPQIGYGFGPGPRVHGISTLTGVTRIRTLLITDLLSPLGLQVRLGSNMQSLDFGRLHTTRCRNFAPGPEQGTLHPKH